jgi:zinc protease
MNVRNTIRRSGALLLGLSLGIVFLEAQRPLVPPFSHYTLKNGLVVILNEDFDLPVVSVAVGYQAGSIYEVPGKTGIAYLLEKLMMSAGSANVSAFEHISNITRVGGSLNATVLEDRTVFYQTVPSDYLAMVLWLESDRMRTLNLAQEKFEKARAELLDELRNRKTTEPYLNSLMAFDRIVYTDFFFGHSLLGDEDDVRNLTLEDVKSFYESRFGPQNAVLCVSGNFKKLLVQEWVTRYFESLPAGKTVPPSFETPVFAKEGVDRTIEDNLASAPALFLGFRLPPSTHPDFPILKLLDFVLMRGRSARLPRRLLNRDKKIAFQLTGGIEYRLHRPVYKIFITASQPQISNCLNATFAELDKVKKAFLSEAEITKAKRLYRQDILNRTGTSMDRAIFFTESYWTLQSAGRLLDDLPGELDNVLKVTASDIVGIMNRYFTVENSVILRVLMK